MKSISASKQRTTVVFILVVILLTVNSIPNLATANPLLLPAPAASMLTGTVQAVNNGAGDQTNPGVDCNVTAYASQDLQGSSRIHFQVGPTNNDVMIPGNGLDYGTSVSGNRIAFTEVNSTGNGVAVYDALTLFRVDIPGTARSNPAVGSDIVAFEDRSYFAGPNLSELGVYDLSTGADMRLTMDSYFDKDPSVSPTGNAVVWEKCQTDGFGCNVYASIQTSQDVFSTRALTSGAGENRNPVTNGQVAVYISNRTGENDIYYQPVAGGAETQIAIPGDQRDLSISGNLIAFTSQVQLAGQTEYDIFVYDLSSAKLYQATSTAVDESGSHISYCNGVGRIVYVSPGADFDVYSFTFQIPVAVSPADQINALIALVRSYNLSPVLENSLVTKLQDALAAVNAGDTATACSSLAAFITKVQSQSDRKIPPDEKTQMINSANQIRANLGCP